MQEHSSWTPAVPLRSHYRPKARSTSCLPTQLVDSIPSCALSCVDNFVQTDYSSATCADTSQLDFLCTHRTISGFTIGEGALQCLVSDCPSSGSETLVYNICAGVANAVPETMATITATIAPSPSLSSGPTTPLSNNLPPSIANPSSTPSMLSIVTATGTPVLSTTSSTLSASTFPASRSSSATFATSSNSPPASSVQPGPQAASTTAAAVAKMQNGLSTGQIAGIAVAGISAAVAVFTILLCVYCIRKKRRQRRPSQRWSTVEFPQHPPTMDQQHIAPGAAAMAPTFSPNQRYYVQASMEESRRSFWRKSIKPQEIGVAVSPEVVRQDSPTSVSSNKTVSRLLPCAPAPSLWPAPLRKSSPTPPRNPGDRPESAATIFEDTGVDNMAQYNPQNTIAPYETRPSDRQNLVARTLPSIDVLGQVHEAERARVSGAAARIPLTPIYDNGNYGSQPQRSMPSEAADAYQWSTSQLHPSSLRATKSSLQDPRGLNISAGTPLQNSGRSKESAHKSIVSDTTEFEDETTPPEEIDGQLKILKPGLGPGYVNMASRNDSETSSIRSLIYPRIPRPAAVSRQAEKVPHPLAAKDLNTSGLRLEASSSRDQLPLRDSNITSLHGRSTDTQLFSLAQRRAKQNRTGQQRDLRIKNANPTAAALNQRWDVDPRPKATLLPPSSARYTSPKTPEPFPPSRSVSPMAKLTPRANSRGDLYLTVED